MIYLEYEKSTELDELFALLEKQPNSDIVKMNILDKIGGWQALPVVQNIRGYKRV